MVFAATGNFSGGDAVKYFLASAGGESHNYTVTDTGSYLQFSFSFTADSTTTELLFQGLRDTGFGAIISDVQVIAVPDAVTQILNGDPTLSYDAATGKFYRVVSAGETVADAMSSAAAAEINGVGGQLATIRSDYENNLVQDLIAGQGANFYIGATDATTEGEWNWIENGEEADRFWNGGWGGSTAAGAYSNWHPGEPSESGAGEDYALIRESDGLWLDVSGAGSYGYVVEWDADDVLSSYTFALLDDAGGRFAIDQSTGEITVADSSLIDYESATSHNITVQTTDATGYSYSEVMTVEVAPSAGDPALTIPAAQSTDEDAPLVFSAGNGNPIIVSDGSATDGYVTVTLAVDNGVLDLSQTTGLTLLDGAQTSGTMTLYGLESAINAALEGMTFSPDAGYNGSASLTVTTELGGLEGHYTFDGGSADDVSAGTNQDGVFVGGADTTIDGDRGEVLNLDAAGEYLRIDDLYGEPTNVTLAAWVNFSSVETNGGEVISLGNDVALRINDWAAGVTGFFYDGTTHQYISSNVSLDPNEWHHVALTFDDANDTQTLYIDGEVVATTNFTSSINWTGWFPQTTIGTHADLADSSFDLQGMIDDARVYTRALTADEIAAMASGASTVSDTVAITVDAVNDAPTFDAGTGYATDHSAAVSDSVSDLLQYGDGSIVTIGSNNQGAGSQIALTRYNPDGSVDSSFGTGGHVETAVGTTDTVRAGALQPDGSIIVVGATNATSPIGSMIVRYNADGSLDSTFGTGGIVTAEFSSTSSEYLSSVIVQPDGKIVAAGYANTPSGEQMTVIRLNADGTLDTSFDGDGMLMLDIGAGGDRINDIILQDDGKLIAVGQSNNGSNNDAIVLRLNEDGSLDTSFDGDGYQTLDVDSDSDSAAAVAIDDSGRIVFGGTTRVSGGSESFAARLNSDGSYDNSFNGTGVAVISAGSPHETINDLTLQSDGKILLAGSAYTSSGINDVSVIRLNTDGSLDTNWAGDGTLRQPIGTATDDASAILVDSDGNVIVAGRTDDGQVGTHIMRFDSSGNLDTRFAPENTLDGNPTFTEFGPAVVLDADVEIHDDELSASDDFGGASLTLVRNGGANADDVFSATGNLVFNGTALELSGVNIGTVTNSGGQLVFTFAAGVTNAQVNEAMQSVAYANSNNLPPASVQIDWTFDDGNSGSQGSGGPMQALGSTVVNIVDVGDNVTANDDSVSTHHDTPLIISPLANDLGPASILEFTQAANGTVVDNGDGTLTYTPDPGFGGSDSFDYTIYANTDGLSHYWNLDGTANDSIGSSNGTLNGTTTTSGSFGNGLSFNEAGDYVDIPDVTYQSEFTISFDFRVDDNSGSLFQYLYSHGDINSTNSINIFLNEASHGTDPNVLRTVIRDGNDTLDNAALQFDISSIVGDGQWHTFTATVGPNGIEVYLDGVLQASDATRGTDGVDPAGNLYLGTRQDFDADRYFGGGLDSLRIYDTALADSEVASLSNTSTGTVNITVNHPPAGSVTIDNTTPAEGDTLTASNTLTDADGIPGSIGYQWYRDGVAIAGATSSTYTTTQSDVGTQISVVASYTDGQGEDESVSSSPTSAVTNVNDPVSGQPVITGTPEEDQTLTADTSGISDADGLGAFSYQWYRDGIAVTGATASAYTLGDSDVGANITVTVSYTDGHGTAESTTSNPVGPVINVNDPVSGQPVITGTPTEDQTLTADTSGISDADGLGTFSYQWYRDGVAIGGATASTYTLGDADVGSNVTVTVSFTDGQGTAESTTSDPVGPVANVNDPVSGQPVITGTPEEDQILTADTSGISDADGLGVFSYQWYRDGVAITGATASTYTLGDSDVGTNITVSVSYTDNEGTAENTISDPVGPVKNVNDPVSGQPVITGTPEEDQTLTADTAGIADADGLGSFNYQWYRDGVAVGGATASTYTLGDADVGANITVTVSYTDAHGTAESTTSDPVGPVANVNDPVSGQPVITGTPAEDQTLAVDTSGISDADGLGAFAYQWYRDGVAISGATASTYTLGDADVGTDITVTVSYTDGQGTAESTTSSAVGPVANVNDPVSGQPIITGTPAEDQTLTADTSGIADADGLGAFAYQWYRDGVAITGATASTYVLGDSDVGANITVTVSYTDGHGTAESTTSNPVGPVTNVNDPVSGQPVITGTPTEDQTLTADTSGISDADGLGTFSYQWYRDGVAIGGATASTYSLGDADVGTSITVTVSYTDTQGTAESTTSNPVGPVTNVNDPVTGQPVITGTPAEDQTLTADTSGISDDDGLGAFSYQWYRDGVAISGATAATYSLGDADVGSNITVTVSYADGQGTAESTSSNPVGPVTNVNDPVSGQPVITGTPAEDQTLTADTSGISDADGLGAFSYQWYRDGVAIGSATASTYTLGDADVGSNITVTVSYTDGQGTAESTTSNPVGPVTNFNDPVSGQPVITGTPTEDQTLSADTSGISDADGLGAFTYQWYRDGVAIGGATASSYTLGDADVGTSITVTVSYTDGQGTAESTTSNPVGPIANVNDPVSGQPVITGTPEEDQTLTADTSGISDADGIGAFVGTFSYQWYRDGIAIGGATASTYTLDDADVGASITVTVSFTDEQGTAENTTSDPVGPVTNVNDPVSGQPVITGTPEEDLTLTADTSGISDADGLGAFSYQWYRDGIAVTGATASTYTLGDSDVGANITVTVSYTDGHGTAESTTSNPVGPVTNVNDPVSGQPVITGTPTEDQTLTADTSGISDADGLGTFSYQWYRDGVAIGGATASTYSLGDADVGTSITVTVSYTDTQGTAESTTSNPVGPVTNVNDPVTGQPVITGTPAEDQTLTADTSGISDDDGLGAFSYQWYRDGVAISGATAATYSLGDADVGSNITVTVSYADGQGTAESTSSNPVGPVTNVNDPVSGQPVITGTPAEDQTLTADTSGISDADGLGAFSYQWYRDGVAIGSATASTYTLGDADVGSNITVTVSYTDGQGTAESTTSNPVGPVTNFNDPVSGQPVITGTPTEDQTLSADTSGISDADGLGAFAYQWYRDGVAISGATAATYTLGDADVGTDITVTVSYTDSQGTAESTTSSAVGPVANVNDAPGGTVTIDNTTPSEGDTLSVSNTLTDADGLSGPVSYQWYRDGVSIAGATASTYTTTQSDIGASLSVVASYTDDQGTPEAVTSAGTAPVINVNSAPTAGNDQFQTSEDNVLTIGTAADLAVSDADGDALQILSISPPANGTVAEDAGGNWVYTPNADFHGTEVLSYVVADPDGATANGTLVIDVLPVNDAPVASASPLTLINEGETAAGTVSATDVDGDIPRFSIAGGSDAGLFAIDSSSGALSFASAPDYEAPADSDADNVYDVVVRVEDGNGGWQEVPLQVEISNVNEAPVANDSVFSVNEAGMPSVVGQVIASDPDNNDALTFHVTGGSGEPYFDVDASSGDIVTNGVTRAGIYDLDVMVVDAAGQSATVSVRVVVEQAATSPPDPLVPANDDGVTVATPASDTSGDPESDSDDTPGASDDSSDDVQATPAGYPGGEFDDIELPHVAVEPRVIVTGEPVELGEATTQELSTRLRLALITMQQTSTESSLEDDEDKLSRIADSLSIELSPELLAALDQFTQDTEGNAYLNFKTAGVAVASISLSAGFISWLLRAGSLLASLLATRPVWAEVDPLPIFNDDEDENDKLWPGSRKRDLR